MGVQLKPVLTSSVFPVFMVTSSTMPLMSSRSPAL